MINGKWCLPEPSANHTIPNGLSVPPPPKREPLGPPMFPVGEGGHRCLPCPNCKRDGGKLRYHSV